MSDILAGIKPVVKKCLTPRIVPVMMTDTMTKTSTLLTVDQALDGKVTKLIRKRRSEGSSAAEIRDALRDELNLTVSERTVARFLAEVTS